MAKSKVGRRGFIKGAAAGAATLATPQVNRAQQPAARPQGTPPTANERALETAVPDLSQIQVLENPGADFMTDVINSLGIEYCFANPGSSFRGLHESMINHAGDKPEFITCTHEEIGAAMCNGYAKAEGRPALTMAHGTVGVQHASMAIYNAYCDQVPMIVIAGNNMDAADRRGRVEWLHAVQDVAATVREFTKWDDNPASLDHFAESMVRGYQLTMTPPMMPVLITADAKLQEYPIPPNFARRIPKLPKIAPPAADPSAINEIARALVAAENPVIVTNRAARTPAGLALLVELAETLGIAVIDQQRRMNFPNRHPLNQTLRQRPTVQNADLILGLEVLDFFGVVHALTGYVGVYPRTLTKPEVKLMSITSSDLFFKSNYQNFTRYQDMDLMVAADAEASLPSLIEACKKLLTEDRKRAIRARTAQLKQLSLQALETARSDAAGAWDASPVATARLSAELWAQIKNEDWSLVTDTFFISNWPLRLWDITKHHQYFGGAGGEGVGYMAPGALGAAVANKKHGRLSVAIQSDGDLMYAAGVLWTAAHHKIPLLTLMHNNRGYHQEVMWLQRMANQHNRGGDVEKCKIGTTLDNPNIDYAKLAQSMGVEAEGPIANPVDLAPAIRRGIAAVKQGRPYLIDVVTQPR